MYTGFPTYRAVRINRTLSGRRLFSMMLVLLFVAALATLFAPRTQVQGAMTEQLALPSTDR